MLIKFNENRILTFGENRIIPGVNSVKDSLWAEMRKDAGIKWKIKNYVIEEIDGNTKDPSKYLQSLSTREAMLMAKETVDVALLRNWLFAEKRTEVKQALNVQLSEIANIEYRDKTSQQPDPGEKTEMNLRSPKEEILEPVEEPEDDESSLEEPGEIETLEEDHDESSDVDLDDLGLDMSAEEDKPAKKKAKPQPKKKAKPAKKGRR